MFANKAGLWSGDWSRYRPALEDHWEPYIWPATEHCELLYRTAALKFLLKAERIRSQKGSILGRSGDVPLEELARGKFHGILGS